MVYDNNGGGEYSKYFVQKLREPPSLLTPEFQELFKLLGSNPDTPTTSGAKTQSTCTPHLR